MGVDDGVSGFAGVVHFVFASSLNLPRHWRRRRRCGERRSGIVF